LCQERHPQAEELPEEPGAAEGQPEKAPGKRQEEQAVPGETRGLLQVLPDHQGPIHKTLFFIDADAFEC
jgi:hypothetical protein